jgi:cytochrome c-type biogenesis protein CcmH/NrfF
VIDRMNEQRAFPQNEGCILRLLAGASLAVLLAAGVFFYATSLRAQQTDRAKQIGQKLLCVCGCNQGLLACNHVGCQYSHAMIKELDDRVARGDSQDLILQSFVQEYGLKVLAEPPTKGFNSIAWVMPVVVPIAAVLLLWEVVRRWRRRAPLAAAGGPPISPELLARARHESGEEPGETETTHAYE